MGPADRRSFLKQAVRASALGLLPLPALAQESPRPKADPGPLLERFPNLTRHFIFEYYPWYGGPPFFEHWDYLDRKPPFDLSSPYVPLLGPYDVRDTAVLERHAEWIAEAGIGSIALSWWGRESFEHLAAHTVMDVMAANGIKVTFALEPYRDDRGRRFRDDVTFLLREFGEKRGYDCLLILRNADGAEGPIFKGFRCILPREGTDCNGRTSLVSDYTPDEVWREQIDGLRHDVRHDFNHITLLADSLEFHRTPASGFDGIGIYDNFIPPELYAPLAAEASRANLLFSFNVNPGYDQIEPRPRPADPCYAPRAFAPPVEAPIDWSSLEGRDEASRLSRRRVASSFQEALAVQLNPQLANAARGFFAIYVNSFNEWHEGHAFEPMRDDADLLPEERGLGYHNPRNGRARLETLRSLMRGLTAA